MKIKEMFIKDLFRSINGVVKVDQQDEAVVWQELDEYVVTRELNSHFNKFFSNYLNAIDNRNDPVIGSQIGVWVSGFFGSGKSHFIKILSYLLHNREVADPSLINKRKASDFFDNKIGDPMLLAEIKRAVSNSTDVVLFNIESKADNKENRSVILSVFMRVFNEMQGFSGIDPHVADIERYLAERNLLEQFHEEFKNVSNEDWLKSRDAFTLMRDDIVEALSRVLNKNKESIGEWIDEAEKKYSLTIDRFAQQVKEYLERRGPDHRIIFIADEVGQFIGADTNLMLNLQTIAEDLGRVCMGRAWIIVTSQEDIDAVLGEVKAKKANDFSKIQGRFPTRLSLSSTNTDEVIQVRLLEKTEVAREELEDLFEKKGEILKHQLSFVNSSGALKSYKDKIDFSKNYPFAPYHFHLVQKIFESIRKAGATGLHLSRGERSMLDAFQYATKNISNNELGALVPLYEFYSPIESFLDTIVKRTVEQANDNPHLEPFDVQLLRVLFLIRYVDIIKSNIDNLVTLCIDTVDADRLALKHKVEESLQRLEKETLINRNGDLFFFLTNEERDVSREIKNVDISSSDEVKKLAELIYDDVLKGESKHRYKPNKRDYGFNRLCDKYVHSSKPDQTLILDFITPLFDEYQLFNVARCVGYSSEDGGRALIKLNDSPELGRELRTYLQTEKYIRLKNDASAPDTLKRILNERANDNQERRKRLNDLLVKLIENAEFYALGQQIQIKATNAVVAINEAQSYLIKNLYNKLDYIDFLHDDPQKEITATLMTDTIGQQNLQLNIAGKNAKALKEIKQFIDLCSGRNQSILLNELIAKFTGYPFGWPDFEIVLIVARLFVVGEITLMMDGAGLKHRDAINPLTKSNQWKQVKLFKHKAVDTADLKTANKLGQELFGKLGPESEEGLYTFLVQELKKWSENLNSFKPLADTKKYPGKTEIDSGLELLGKLDIQDSYEFFEMFNKWSNDLKDLYDDIHDLDGFYNNQKATWERLQDVMNGIFKDNRNELEKTIEAQQALQRMDHILTAPHPYGMLKESDSLIATVEKINEDCIIKCRDFAISKVDEKIVQIKQDLATIKADADLSNKSLFPLQDIKRKMQTERSIPGIFYHQSDALKELENAHELIDQQRQQQQVKVGTPVKKTKMVNVISVAKKSYLETPDDVATFLDDLKQELDAAINNNMRVQLK